MQDGNDWVDNRVMLGRSDTSAIKSTKAMVAQLRAMELAPLPEPLPPPSQFVPPGQLFFVSGVGMVRGQGVTDEQFVAAVLRFNEIEVAHAEALVENANRR